MSNHNRGGGAAFLAVGVTFMVLVRSSRVASGTTRAAQAPDGDAPDAPSGGGQGPAEHA